MRNRWMMLGLGALVGGLVVAAAGSPSAVTAPTARTPSQVEVVNFPDPQQVAGTVNVGNLPPVQNVAGAVEVSNLPLDTEGNIRVVGIPSGPPFTFTKIVDGLSLTDGLDLTLNPIAVGGWKNAHVFARVTGLYDPDCFRFYLKVGGAGVIATDTSIGGCYGQGGPLFEGVSALPVLGPELTLRGVAFGHAGMAATADIWLYLSN